MRLHHTLVLVLMFSIACIEAPPDDDTDPDTISENNIGTNVVTSNNTSTNNGMAQVCDPEFAEADACGGDVVGKWNAEELCGEFDFSQVLVACPTATVSNQQYNFTGTLEFTAPNAVTRNVTVTATATIKMRGTCTVGGGNGGGNTRCTTLQTLISQRPDLNASCANSMGECSCNVTYTDSTDGAGTYTTTGGVLEVTEFGDVSRYHYCVEGGSLQARQFGANATEGDFSQVYVK